MVVTQAEQIRKYLQLEAENLFHDLTNDRAMTPAGNELRFSACPSWGCLSQAPRLYKEGILPPHTHQGGTIKKHRKQELARMQGSWKPRALWVQMPNGAAAT